MYREHFGLTELPFSIAPNPRYLYLTQQHQEALAHLIYGLNSAGGVILLTGEVGTGKTTISRKLLEDIPDNIVIAWIVNPRLSVEELLAAICDELSINYPAGNRSIKIFTDLISDCLIFAHGQGHNVVLMIDEAQNLSPEVLEQLRLLTNLETNERKLLQIVLLGQPELKTMLERNDLRQLAQRITARYHLHELSRMDTVQYIRHRLAVGGCSKPVFTDRAMTLIYRISHGTPRLINLLCDRAMLGVYSANADMVRPKHVRQASIEVLGEAGVHKRSVMIPATIALLLVGTGIFASGAWEQLAGSRLHGQPEQAAVLLPSSASEAEGKSAIPVITSGRLTELKTLSASVPDPSKKATPTAEVLQPNTPEITGRAGLVGNSVQGTESMTQSNPEAIPVQPGKTVPEPIQADEATKPPAMPRVASTHKDMIDQPIVATVDHANVQPPASPWSIIEKTGSRMLAFRTLAGIWHSTVVSEEGDPCKQLSDHRLSCLKQHANIWLLRKINRPAIFQISGQNGASRYGVIRFISHGSAIIQLGMQQWRVRISELKQHMHGQLSVLWFKPPGYQKDLQQGDSGTTVEWLAAQLDRIQGSMIPARDHHNMDDILVQRLKDFQKSNGIMPDGIAGVLTLMRINEHIGLDSPRLQSVAKN